MRRTFSFWFVYNTHHESGPDYFRQTKQQTYGFVVHFVFGNEVRLDKSIPIQTRNMEQQ